MSKTSEEIKSVEFNFEHNVFKINGVNVGDKYRRIAICVEPTYAFLETYSEDLGLTYYNRVTALTERQNNLTVFFKSRKED